MQQQAVTSSRSGPRMQVSQGTCLIVEDSEFDSERIKRVINKSLGNMKVKVAPTLEAAREWLEEEQIALILLDNNLPDGLGANFALEIAQDDRLDGIPIIIISDWPSPFMWEKAARAGVNYVVNKSEFDARYVVAALKARRKKRARVN